MIVDQFTFPGTALTVRRVGYGAMQLAGPGVWGPPKDKATALAVLRAAMDAGVDHIDTSDSYGPHVTNQLIREALHPYPAGLVIVTKVGCLRGEDGSWPPSYSRRELEQATEDNYRNLGWDTLDERYALRACRSACRPSPTPWAPVARCWIRCCGCWKPT